MNPTRFLRSFLPVSFLLALALPACSSATTDDGASSDADESSEELRSTCGGIANIQCAAGKRCVLSSQHPDATGHCWRECGGFAGIECPSSQECKLDGNFPDAAGVCQPKHTTHTQTCASVRCLPGFHCEDKGINGGTVPVCLQDDTGGPHCPVIDCAPGYHCEEKGMNGGGTHGVCLADQPPPPPPSGPHCPVIRCKPGFHCEEKGLNGGSIGVCLAD